MENILKSNLDKKDILKYTISPIIMMIFTALYTMADGMFSSIFIGTDALSSINIVYPYISLIIAMGVMLGVGGSAIVGKKLGENNSKGAKESFTQIIVIASIIGIAISLLARIFINPLIRFLGASDILYQYTYDYLKIISIFSVFNLLQQTFQMLFITAGKPKVGLTVTVIGGSINIVFDYIFIHLMNMGIEGAAFATIMGQTFIALYGFIYFSIKKETIHFTKFQFNIREAVKVFANGSSEMVTNMSVSIVTLLFNITMLKLLGEDGVAAVTIILYLQFLFSSIFIGFSNGIAPIESYFYGSRESDKLKRVFRNCMTLILIFSISMLILAYLASGTIISIFADKGTNVYNITLSGGYLFYLCFIFQGFNIYASSLFTALSNGKISAFISFTRTLLFTSISMMILPSIIGVNGVWLSVPIAEVLTIIISIIFLLKYKRQYKYL